VILWNTLCSNKGFKKKIIQKKYYKKKEEKKKTKTEASQFKWAKWKITPYTGLHVATSAGGLINGDFCQNVDLMGVIPRNGDFCQWFDEWRLLPMVWLMTTSAIMIDWWVLSRKMVTFVYGLIVGESYLWFDWYILSLRDGDFCQIVD